jgi:hypothetical protein
MAIVAFPEIPPGSSVPVIGAPFVYQSWFPTVLVTCGCERKTPLLMVGRSIAICHVCGRRLAVKSIRYDGVSGNVDVEIGLVAGVSGGS